MATNAQKMSYPGSNATVGQFIGLADEYCVAAYVLLSQADRASSSSSAPARLCAIHAVEMYLNAFLVFHDVSPSEVRGMQHDLAQRVAMVTQKGLILRTKTQAHLLRIHDLREYLIVRYGPEQMGGLPELNRLYATLREVSVKVRTAILDQGYDPSDSRFRRYW
ncbi:hypothetical protein PRN20_15035 [Devosia sp. ZB163]|uniref:hypothetical protein n=1 Tax=Devosia sp. ZB163 TaxID=3025938 RepID=UPI00235F548E|nr:hypothetical protein [Devosia sp. ZB163]MDC9825044.1 hypothetical protein [Devosia sp. ZB163]